MMLTYGTKKLIKMCRVHSLYSAALILFLVLYIRPLQGSALRGLLEGACPFHSQYGQDEYLERNFFKGKRGGVYVDLGAYHPYEISNTAFFDKCRSWTGLCVDANKHRAQLFEGQRSCKFVHACLTAPNVVKSTLQNMDSEDRLGTGHEVVPCTPINKILKDAGITHIDYLSRDVEGQEWAVLQQLNFTQISVRAISVETWHGNRTAIRDYLQDAGFVHAAELGADDIYYWHGAPWLPSATRKWRTEVRGIRPHKEF
jgi:hypothetical protein